MRRDKDLKAPSNRWMRREYDALWNRSMGRLITGDVDADPVPTDGSERWGISVILPLTGTVADSLASTAKELASLVVDRQIVYSISNLHTTLRTVEYYRAKVPQDDPKVRQYVEVLRGVARDYDPLRVEYAGLAASPLGVLAQGWPIGGDFQAIRRDFHHQLAAHGLLNGPEAEAIRRSAHASLVVFTRPLRDGIALARYVEDNRRTPYGTVTFESAELVRYKRTESKVSIIPLAKVHFGVS